MIIEVTPAEAAALGAAATYAACDNGMYRGMPREDVATMKRLKKHALDLMVSSGIQPTELKNLGLRIVTATVNATEDLPDVG